MRTSDLVASIGVCAHLNDTSSSYATSDVAGQMSYLGLSNMRVTEPDKNLALYTSLGKLGIKFDVISGTTNLSQQIGYLESLAPYLAFAEGPNEVNTAPVSYKGLSGAAAAQSYQADFYAAVHSDRLLAGVSVLPFSLSVGGSTTGFGNVAAYADYGNVHGYAGSGSPPYYMLSYAINSVTTTPGKTPIMTETGYYTLDDKASGVTQDVQAKWLLDTLLQNASSGVAQTYLYQLEDAYNDPTSDPENHYGLFTTSGVAKQSAVDLHNLTSILADGGATASTFKAATLEYAVTGLSPDYGNQALFAKSNGKFDLALWSEPAFYNPAQGAASVTPSSVIVSFSTAHDVDIFDPIIGTAAIAHYSGVYSVAVPLGTDPLIVEVGPTSVAHATVAAGGPATIGSGPDQIVVGLSEDAFQGDAQATIQVDGQQIGGIQTVTALHKTGDSQALTLLGNFGADSHTVTVTFLNDAYDAKTGGDRNLYIDTMATASGSTAVGASLLSAGSQQFTVTIPVPVTTVATTTLGSGSDAITVGVSEDAYSGDAQATLQVDGKQIGGIQTVTASHAAGASQAFKLLGSFGSGTHTVTVTFLNDAYDPKTGADRNLYVDTVGSAAGTSAVATALLSAGSATFNVALPAQPTPAPTPVQTAPVNTVGAGADSIEVGLSEDAYQGDAQATFLVDGKAVGGVQTVTALHKAGASQVFTLLGTFGAGKHTVTVSFGNDLYNAATGQDRNLYIDSVGTSAGLEQAGLAQMSNGSTALQVELAQQTTTLGAGADVITVNVSEDAYLGDAQAAFFVDGKAVGGTQTVTALHAAGATQSFALKGAFGSGAHKVTVRFLNDAFGGTAATDRNLYVDGVLTNVPSVAARASILSTGGKDFQVVIGSATSATTPSADFPPPATVDTSGTSTSNTAPALAGFDAAYYLAQNPDVAAAGVDPLQHYLTFGWLEGRNPSAVFDTNYYLTANPDVKAANVDPLLHYDAFGMNEGRDPSLVFSTSAYLTAHPGLAAGTNPLADFMQNAGSQSGMSFLAGSTAPADLLVNAAYYDKQLGATIIPTGTQGAEQAAWSYAASGWQKGLNPDSLFDTNYYLSHNPDVAAAHVDPLLHYEMYGWLEGRDPSAQFSTTKYLAAYGDVKQAGVDPLLHYVAYGQTEGRTAFAV